MKKVWMRNDQQTVEELKKSKELFGWIKKGQNEKWHRTLSASKQLSELKEGITVEDMRKIVVDNHLVREFRRRVGSNQRPQCSPFAPMAQRGIAKAEWGETGSSREASPFLWLDEGRPVYHSHKIWYILSGKKGKNHFSLPSWPFKRKWTRKFHHCGGEMLHSYIGDIDPLRKWLYSGCGK